MKTLIPSLMLIIIILPALLIAGENDDLIFAAGLYADGNLTLAQQQLEKFISEHPQSEFIGDARYLLATIYLEQQEFSTARPLWLQLYKTLPEGIAYSDILHGLAVAQYQTGHFNEAVDLINTLLTKYPDYYDKGNMYLLLGKAYNALQQPDKALSALNLALNLQDSPDLRKELIETHLQLNNPQKARENLTETLKKFPQNDQTHYSLLLYCKFNLEINNYQEILDIAAASQIDQNSPYYDQYKLIMGIANFESGSYEKSISFLDKLDDDKALYYYALNLIKTGALTQATAILNNLYQNSQGEVKANALFYLAKLTDDEKEKISLLSQFIDSSADNAFRGEARYLLGLTYFKTKDYSSAARIMQENLQNDLLPADFIEESSYIAAESFYQNDQKDKAEAAFKTFLQKYPSSSYNDEVYFKIGLINFYKENYDTAEENFKIIAYNYLDSPKFGMSNFYLGEISLLANKLSEARRFYNVALTHLADKDMVNLRLARTWQMEKNYTQAENHLFKVSANSSYAKKKNIMLGDIYFAWKRYDKAAQSYNSAIKLETEQKEIESLSARLAWTYYQLEDYEKASNIYSQLSIRTDNPAVYTFQAATALFSAQQYDLALKKYQTFVDNFSESPDYTAAQVGIADCYYNMQDYENAARQYRKLLVLVNEPELYRSVLDGWKWSLEQSGKDFLTEINLLLNENIPYNFRFLISSYKVEYLYQEKKYQQTIELVDQLKRNYSYPMQNLEYLRARALKKLKRWEEADDFYSKLFAVYKDPEVQYEWAEVTLELDKINTTVRKLQYAAEKLQKPEYIIQLLTLEVEHNHEGFNSDYQSFLPALKGIDRERALALKTTWLINQKDFSAADEIIQELLQSDFRDIQAEGQFLKGYSLYEKGEYDLAVPELLRVRHLFPYLLNIRQKAEEIAFYAYLKNGKKQEAQNLFNNIEHELSTEKRATLQKMLDGE